MHIYSDINGRTMHRATPRITQPGNAGAVAGAAQEREATSGREEEHVGIFGTRTRMITAEEALPGRNQPMPVPAVHEVLGTPLRPPYPEGSEIAEFALGCFWGAERKFWQVPGVISTSVGYEGGFTPNPTYEEVCSGRTGHAEAVRVVFDPAKVSYASLLKVFWESHDPTQGMRQGNDIGTQYRSAIYWHSQAQRDAAEQSATAFQEQLTRAGYGAISTEIQRAPEFYFAEDYHQQYLSDAKNPNGYCGLGGTGVSCPVGVASAGG
jgi:peptide-methionine (S)-S-oxide reductase